MLHCFVLAIRQEYCHASGDPHIQSFDRVMFHYMGVCTYTLSRPQEGSDMDSFEVQIKNEHRGNTVVAYVRHVIAIINDNEYKLDKDGAVFVS